MGTFAFRAVDLAGVPSRGELEAASKAQVTEQLRQRGLIVLDVTEKHEAMQAREPLPALQERQPARPRGLLAPVRDADRLGHADAALALHARGPDRGRDAEDGDRRRCARTSRRAARVRRRDGAPAGRLRPALPLDGARRARGRAASRRRSTGSPFQLEKLDALRRQVRSAMTYPAVVFALALVVMIVVVAFIVPVFVGIFEEIAAESRRESAELPFMTQITVGGLGLRHRPVVPPSSRSIAVLTYAFMRWKKTERGRAPVGPLQAEASRPRSATWSRRSRWRAGRGPSRARSPRACRSCRRSRSRARRRATPSIEEAMDDVYDSVKRGGSIAAPLARAPDLPADGLPHGLGRRGIRTARDDARARSPTSTRPRSTPRSRR